MSASTVPGPTEGSWSTSPTSTRQARGGTARSSWFISTTSTIDASSTTSRSRSSGLSRVALEAAQGRVELQQAVDGLGLAAGRLRQALGGPARRAHRAQRSRLAAKISRMPRTIVVLPTPGPPVMTSTFCASPARMASRCVAASSRPIFFSTQASGRVDIDGRQRMAALAQLAQARATPSSARNSGFRYSHGSLRVARLRAPARRPAARASTAAATISPESMPVSAGGLLR